MPSTRPDTVFYEDGVCDACKSSELKEKIDWDERRKQLAQILEKYRSKDGSRYDCLIPSSGGKDSHYQTYVIVKEFGLRPLVVTWTPCNQTALGKKNIENLKRLGVDYIEFTGNPHVYRKLVKEGFKRVGDCCWPEHVGIFTVPVQVAVNYKIPLIIWGENPQLEYGGPEKSRFSINLDRRWLEEFGGLLGNRVQDMIGFEGLTKQDLLPYIYPSIEELEKVGVAGIFLGSFIKWDARRQLEIIKKCGFSVNEEGPQEGTYTNYENLDCKYVGLHDYLKFVKFGFGRATDHACIDIRNKRLSREEGLELVKKYDGKVPRKYLAEFLKEMEMGEEEFFKIIDSFTNKSIFKKDENGNLIKDKEGNLIKNNYDNISVEETARVKSGREK